MLRIQHNLQHKLLSSSLTLQVQIALFTPEILISFPQQVQTSRHNESGCSGKKKVRHTLFLVPKAR